MKRTNYKFHVFAKAIWAAIVLVLWGIIASQPALGLGYWTPLAHQPSGGVELMLLLSDGTVMAQSSGGTGWFHLLPDSQGLRKRPVD